MAINAAFTPYTNAYRLDLSTSSANVQIGPPTAGPSPVTLRATNTGTVAAQIVWAYADSAPTAVAATVGTSQPGVVVAGGESAYFSIGAPPSPSQKLWIAGVSVSGTATMYFTLGEGR